jgi:hypothetical protein
MNVDCSAIRTNAKRTLTRLRPVVLRAIVASLVLGPNLARADGMSPLLGRRDTSAPPANLTSSRTTFTIAKPQRSISSWCKTAQAMEAREQAAQPLRLTASSSSVRVTSTRLHVSPQPILSSNHYEGLAYGFPGDGRLIGPSVNNKPNPCPRGGDAALILLRVGRRKQPSASRR